jgi:hypothetical protein
MRSVLASSAIDGRLTVDRQVSQLVHLGQLLVDDRSLLGRRLARPRQRFEFVPTELGKKGGNVREPDRKSDSKYGQRMFDDSDSKILVRTV